MSDQLPAISIDPPLDRGLGGEKTPGLDIKSANITRLKGGDSPGIDENRRLSKTGTNASTTTLTRETHIQRVSDFSFSIMSEPLYLISISAVGILISVLISVGAIHFAVLTILPSLLWYNLLHVIVGVAGSVLVYCSQLIINHLEDCTLAVEIEAGRGHPVRLSELGKRSQRRLVPKDFTRVALVWCRWLYVFSIWLVGLNFEWAQVDTSAGTFGCIPATYTTYQGDPNFDILNFVVGGTTFATIYSYGLPLSDGGIGGWAAWPLAGPLLDFSVTAEGPVYVVQTLCSDITVLNMSQNPPNFGTVMSATLVPSIAGYHIWTVDVIYPATSVLNQTNPTMQTCNISVKFGTGTLQFTFTQDEWQMVTGGIIDNIITGPLNLANGATIGIGAQETAAALSMALSNHQNLETWADQEITAILNTTTYPSQGVTFSNLLQWSTQPDGFYYPNFTYRGITAVVLATLQFLTMQYDPTQVANCEYWGRQGAGVLSVPIVWLNVITAVGAICAALGFAQVFEWFWKYRSHADNLKAIRSLNDPLRLAYDLRRTWFRKGDPDLGDAPELEFKEWTETQKVVYGEFKSSEHFERGELGYGNPKEIIPIKKGRAYRVYRRRQEIEKDDE